MAEEQVNKKLRKKLQKELDELITELLKEPAMNILRRAEEFAVKEEITNSIYLDDLTEEEAEALFKKENVLRLLYLKWLEGPGYFSYKEIVFKTAQQLISDSADDGVEN